MVKVDLCLGLQILCFSPPPSHHIQSHTPRPQTHKHKLIHRTHRWMPHIFSFPWKPRQQAAACTGTRGLFCQDLAQARSQPQPGLPSCYSIDTQIWISGFLPDAHSSTHTTRGLDMERRRWPGCTTRAVVCVCKWLCTVPVAVWSGIGGSWVLDVLGDIGTPLEELLGKHFRVKGGASLTLDGIPVSVCVASCSGHPSAVYYAHKTI